MRTASAARSRSTGGEIGYWIHAEHGGRGLATEAAAALTQIGFLVHRVEWIEIRCNPDNMRSRAIPPKLGYLHETTLPNDTTKPDGRPRDTMVWAMKAARYPTSPAAGYDVRVGEQASGY